jgi:hypothetical protein
MFECLQCMKHERWWYYGITYIVNLIYHEAYARCRRQRTLVCGLLGRRPRLRAGVGVHCSLSDTPLRLQGEGNLFEQRCSHSAPLPHMRSVSGHPAGPRPLLPIRRVFMKRGWMTDTSAMQMPWGMVRRMSPHHPRGRGSHRRMCRGRWCDLGAAEKRARACLPSSVPGGERRHAGRLHGPGRSAGRPHAAPPG